MALNLFLGEIAIPVTTWTTTVGGNPARDINNTAATKSAYMRAVSGGAGGESLCDTPAATDGMVSAAINGDWGANNCDVQFSYATGLTRIYNFAGAPLTLTLSAPLAVALGFSAPVPAAPAAWGPTAIGSGAYATSTYQAQYVWLPNVEPSGLAAYVGSPGKPIHDAKVAISNSGAYKRTIGPARYECPMTFKGLTARKAWQSSETVLNESLESFWDDCMNYGRIVRWFDDRSEAAYTQAFRLKSETLELKEAQANYQSVWTVDLVFTQSVES